MSILNYARVTIGISLLFFATRVSGQNYLPPGRPPVNQPGVDLGTLMIRMAERVRSLGQEMTAEINRNDAGRYLNHDLQELSRSLEDFREQLPAIGNNPFQLRRHYSSINLSWRQLRARLVGPVLGIPSVVRAARRVDEADAELSNALGLNQTPPDEVSGPPPTQGSQIETRRLARSLVDRAEAVAATARAELARRPDGIRLINDTTALAQEADRFHDNLPQLAMRPGGISRAFEEVLRNSARVQNDLVAIQTPPATALSWRGYQVVENLLRNQIRSTNVPPGDFGPFPIVAPAPPVVNITPAVTRWADELLREINALSGSVQAGKNRIPEWPAFMIDIERLRNSAADFRNQAARGFDIPRLAHKFREVDEALERLSRRMYRVSRGQQSGPNIDAVKRMGAIVGQVHQILGMPDYASGVVIAPR